MDVVIIKSFWWLLDILYTKIQKCTFTDNVVLVSYIQLQQRSMFSISSVSQYKVSFSYEIQLIS